ncbi:MAG: HAD family hydrolase [Fusobacteriaceae bacterium]
MSKIIFFDIDGTILDYFNGITKLTEGVKAAIRTLKNRGDYIFVATGRPYAFLNNEILEFGFDGFVLSNGAHVIINDKTVHKSFLEKTFLRELIEILDENKIEYLLNGEKFSYLKKEYHYLYSFFQKVGVTERYIEREYELEDINVFKVEIMCLNEEQVEKCIKFMALYPEYDYFSSIGSMNLEVYSKINTKAAGILKTLEQLNISIENSYAFGDGENDIEMLATVQYGIAMGNASEEVKGYAKYVTETVEKDGVAAGIKKYII